MLIARGGSLDIFCQWHTGTRFGHVGTSDARQAGPPRVGTRFGHDSSDDVSAERRLVSSSTL